MPPSERRSERPVTILAQHRSPDRCRRCRRKILWVVTAPKGKGLPLDCEPIVLSRSVNPETGVHFESIAPTAIHRCPPPKTTNTTPKDQDLLARAGSAGRRRRPRTAAPDEANS